MGKHLIIDEPSDSDFLHYHPSVYLNNLFNICKSNPNFLLPYINVFDYFF